MTAGPKMVRATKICLWYVLVLLTFLITKMPLQIPLSREAGRDRRKDVTTKAGLTEDKRPPLIGKVSIIFLILLCFTSVFF